MKLTKMASQKYNALSEKNEVVKEKDHIEDVRVSLKLNQND